MVTWRRRTGALFSTPVFRVPFDQLCFVLFNLSGIVDVFMGGDTWGEARAFPFKTFIAYLNHATIEQLDYLRQS